MSSPRLSFLYPLLFRTARLGEPAAQSARRSARGPVVTTALRCQHASPIGTATTARRADFVKRHGKAVEPTTLPAKPETPAAKGDSQAKPETPAAKSDSQTQGEQGGTAKKDVAVKSPQGEKKAQVSPGDTAEQAGKAKNDDTPVPPESEPAKTETKPQQAPPGGDDPPPTDSSTTSQAGGPIDAILHMGPPEDHQEADDTSPKPPHLSPSPYVHHFDSYSLVKQLAGGGWTPVQAITAMKAVRGILAANLDVAQAGLVSKSDVENETYLFRAACSELGTEMRNSRRIADGRMRQQRTTLQHEVDILTQSLNQEVLTLNDTVRGMFNDRKMAVREEQKAAESAIQQINYKITILLNSDAKSEIEAVRWVLIRRSVLGILIMAVLTLGSLRYASYRSHMKQKEQNLLLKEAEAIKEEGRLEPDVSEMLAAS